jgi:UDP-N-acetylmuramoylalanine--D-glutamate ligase
MPETVNISAKIDGARCTVIGLGISNIPLIDYLLSKNAAKITVCDKNKSVPDSEHISRFAKAGVEFVCGDNYLDGIEADIIFRSPGVRPWEDGIKKACDNGAILSSEMELFFELCPCRIIAVTGSDGKTTTTTLINLLLTEEFKKSGDTRHVFVGGNIGAPLLPRLEQMKHDDIAVVELSSFQLYTMKRSPDIAVITNLAPNHLDWHSDFEDYCQAKYNIFAHDNCKKLITNAANGTTSRLGAVCKAPITWFSSDKDKTPDNCYTVDSGEIVHICKSHKEPILKVSDIKIKGKHNIENYMAAIAALEGIVCTDTVKRVATSFGGVEHRIEFVREIGGVKYYNSSIDSSPSRTIAALNSFDEPLTVICCGRDKHVPFFEMADELCIKADTVILTGELAPQLKEAISVSKNYSQGHPSVIEAKDLAHAVALAKNHTPQHHSVLLSPGGTSFDCYKNFEERGRHFKELVNALDKE